MSGVIAVQGDKVGKMLGKKRLSIFGLRPRHTASLGTVLVGVSISTLTIIAVMGASSGVREWVLKGPSLLQEANERLTKLVGEANNASVRNKDLANKNTKMTRDLASRQQELQAAQANLTALQNQIDTLSPRIKTLTDKVAAGSETIQHLNASEKNLRNAALQGEADLAKVKAQVTQAKASYSTLVDDSHKVNNRNLQLTEENDKLQKEQARLMGEQDRLNREISKIEADTKEAIATRDQTQLELKESQRVLEDTQKQLSSLKAELAGVEKELSDSDQANGIWYGINKISRREPMIYRFGEEVVRLPVRAHLSASSARSELTSLMRMARVDAQRRGAQSNARYPVAGIFDHSDKATGSTIPTAVIEKQVEAEITGAKSELVMIASSSLNAFRGEPVSLEITVMPNPAIYSRGQIIVESVIDANRGDTVISEEFSKFLQETVKQRAEKDGMIPIANSDYSFGQVTLPEILQVIEQLRKTDRRVRLAAISSSNTRAADTLKLEFRLR